MKNRTNDRRERSDSRRSVKSRIFSKTALLIAVVMMVCMLPTAKVEASFGGNNYKPFAGSGVEKFDVYETDNVANEMYPSPDKANVFYMFSNIPGVGEITVTKPSVIKAYYTWDTMDKSNTVSGQSWFSWDAEGAYPLGAKWSLSQPASSAYVFVDPGTYYLNQVFTIKSGSSDSSRYISITILVEPIGSTEERFETSATNANLLQLGKDNYGFLSTNSPEDWYRFYVTEPGRVDIRYYFYDKAGNRPTSGKCTLFKGNLLDGNIQKPQTIEAKTFNATNYEVNTISKYLEPGEYYLSMTGTTGPTFLRAEFSPYEVTVSGATTKATNKDVTVYISTSVPNAEVRVVKGSVGDTQKTDNTVWKNSTDITATGEYVASENGTYTVRVWDRNGQYILRTFKVTGIDKEAPVITGIENGGSGKADSVTFYMNDNVDVTSLNINGYNINVAKHPATNGDGYQYKLTKKKSYIITIGDAAGNLTTYIYTLK